jgi:hypothetical protein
MSEDKKYNGWTNYATWRINLEVFDDHYLLAEQYENIESVYELSKILQEYTEEIIEQDVPESNKNGLSLSYARVFIQEVNYYEIAIHIWEQIEENKKEELEELKKLEIEE